MNNEIIFIFSLKVKIYNLAALLRSVFSPTLSTEIGSRYVTWHSEESMIVVLNVDGSSFGNLRISDFGGVLRRNDDNWLYGFAENVGISTVIHVELLALYHGLKAAWEKGYKDVICYSDSTLVVHLVSTMVNPWHHYVAIINNVQDLLQRNLSVQLKHSVSEANLSQISLLN